MERREKGTNRFPSCKGVRPPFHTSIHCSFLMGRQTNHYSRSSTSEGCHQLLGRPVRTRATRLGHHSSPLLNPLFLFISLTFQILKCTGVPPTFSSLGPLNKENYSTDHTMGQMDLQIEEVILRADPISAGVEGGNSVWKSKLYEGWVDRNVLTSYVKWKERELMWQLWPTVKTLQANVVNKTKLCIV